MTEILERIKEAYNLETDAEVAKFLELKPSTLSMQKNRGRLNLKRIIEKCNDLNRNWLLDGEGPKKKEDIKNKPSGIPVYSSISFADNGKPNFQKSVKSGEIFVDVTEELRQFSSVNRLIGYVISGNGMAPALRAEDIAIFDLDRTKPKDKSFFLISFDHQVLCRPIKEKSANNFVVSSSNFDDESSENSEIQNGYEILGKMIWVLRKMQ